MPFHHSQWIVTPPQTTHLQTPSFHSGERGEILASPHDSTPSPHAHTTKSSTVDGPSRSNEIHDAPVHTFTTVSSRITTAAGEVVDLPIASGNRLADVNRTSQPVPEARPVGTRLLAGTEPTQDKQGDDDDDDDDDEEEEKQKQNQAEAEGEGEEEEGEEEQEEHDDVSSLVLATTVTLSVAKLIQNWKDIQLGTLFLQNQAEFGFEQKISANDPVLKKDMAFFANRLNRKGFESFQALCGTRLPAKEMAHWIREQQEKVK